MAFSTDEATDTPPDPNPQVDHLLDLAHNHESAQRWGDAEAAYAEALRLEHDCAEAAFGLGAMAMRRGEHETGLANLILATELDPEDAHYWSELGSALALLGQHEASLAAFEASLECDFTEEQTFIHIAEEKFNLRRFDETAAYTGAMPLMQTRYPILLILQASALLALDRLPEAREAALKGVTLFPDNPQLLALAGNIESLAGDPVVAEAYLRRAIAQAPRDYDATVGLAALLAGKEAPASQSDRINQALIYAVSIDPNRFEAPLLLATLAFQAGDKAGMEHWTKEGLKAAPWHPGLLFLLGLLAAEDGKLDVAEAVFAAAVTVNPLHQASQFALANCLLRRGETERAAVHLRSTVRIGGKTEQGKAATALLKQIGGT
jgi:tetratricopeptide (TPR) repeat protein